MKKQFNILFFCLMLVLAVVQVSYAANEKTGFGETATPLVHYEGVSVDTDPGAAGYWSDPVYVKWAKDREIWFCISAITGATVTLQFKDVGETTWSEYDTYTEITTLKIAAHPDSQWRTGVADNNQGTSSVSKIGW